MARHLQIPVAPPHQPRIQRARQWKQNENENAKPWQACAFESWKSTLMSPLHEDTGYEEGSYHSSPLLHMISEFQVSLCSLAFGAACPRTALQHVRWIIDLLPALYCGCTASFTAPVENAMHKNTSTTQKSFCHDHVICFEEQLAGNDAEEEGQSSWKDHRLRCDRNLLGSIQADRYCTGWGDRQVGR